MYEEEKSLFVGDQCLLISWDTLTHELLYPHEFDTKIHVMCIEQN